MQRHYALPVLLTVLILATAVYCGFINFKAIGLPFAVTIVNAHTALIEPIEGIPLPSGIQIGDQLDLTTMSRDARIAISIQSDITVQSGNLPLGQAYDFVIKRGQSLVTIPVTTENLSAARGVQLSQWEGFLLNLLIAGIALLTLWRGNSKAATGMALWTISLLIGNAGAFPLAGDLGLGILLGTYLSSSLARVGFYVMADAMISPILNRSTRILFLTIFVLLLAAGAIPLVAGIWIFVNNGWTGLVLPAWGLSEAASYLFPVVMLLVSYRPANLIQRPRLRWMLWSGAAWTVGIFIADIPLVSVVLGNVLHDLTEVIAMLGFLYAVLRHRMVDISVVINRTLVYGGVTALVVGVLAAVNSIVQHAALGSSASLLLQIVVPLALGIVLGQVKNYAGRIVERVFFRKRYLAEKVLRRFARHCNRFERADELLQQSVQEIHRRLNIPGVAIYERREEGYVLTQHGAGLPYPQRLNADDPAMVTARGNQKDIDVSELHSALGNDGYVFPMIGPGGMQGVLVCANRPGEHFASDERKLLAYVARQMGMALHALRVQDALRRLEAKSILVDALANGTFTSLPEVQAKALELVTAAAPS
ncbi:MAG: GAF domain-containing protein [Gammaproteobacteria bacterium]